MAEELAKQMQRNLEKSYRYLRVGKGWAHGHHIETIRKTLRIILRGITERFKGLGVRQRRTVNFGSFS